MGIAESALILLGIGIVSQKFGAGLGLEQLGVGIKTLAAAPLGGVGLGLGEFAGGLRGIGEAIGDIGRGFGDLFANIPQLPTIPGGGLPGPGRRPPEVSVPSLPRLPVTPMVVKAGGGGSDLLPGGGGSTPPAPPPPPSQPSYIQPPRTVYYLIDPVSINERLKPVMM